MNSFANTKALRFRITLGSGTFRGGDKNQIILEGFRASVDIDKAGGLAMGTLRAKVYGILQQDMNAITTIAMRTGAISTMLYLPNTVEVFAIVGTAETLIFAGNIVNAWADYSSMPDVFLHIQAQSAYFNQLNASSPRSFKGQIDVSTVMAQLAKQMGYQFEDNGVNVQLSDVYLANTALEQAKDLAKAAGIVMVIDDDILAICPPNTPRRSDLVPVISSVTGLVGYPTFDGPGVVCQTLFNPALRFMSQFKLISDQARAAGVWTATCISHRLESEKPNGAWFSTVRGNFENIPYVGK